MVCNGTRRVFCLTKRAIIIATCSVSNMSDRSSDSQLVNPRANIHSFSQSIKQSTNQSFILFPRQSISQEISYSVSKSANQSVSQSARKSVSQSVRHIFIIYLS